MGEGLGLGENFAVVAGGDGRLEPPFLGVEAELGEAVGCETAGLPLLELGERTSPPQGEGLGQRVGGTVGFAELPAVFESLRAASPHCKVLIDPGRR